MMTTASEPAIRDGLFLPASIGRRFAGHRAVPWLVAPVLLVKLAMGTNVLLNPRLVATRADGLPIEQFPAAAAASVMAFFALWGFEQLLLALAGLLILWRYRAALPLLISFVLAEQLGRRLVLAHYPTGGGSALASAINLGLALTLLIGLGLCFVRPASPVHR